MTIPIQIPNGTYNLNVQISDPNTILLVIVTAIVAIATCVVAWVTYSGNKKSNQETRNSNERAGIEFKLRMKPVFVFDNIETFWSGALPMDKISIGFKCLIRNTGMLSARRINVKVIQTYNTKIEDVIKEFPSNLGGISIMPIPRDHTEPFNYIKLKKDKGIYMALWFDYVYFNEIKDQSLAIILLDVERKDIIPIWYDYDDIKEGIKWNEDGMSGKRHAPT